MKQKRILSLFIVLVMLLGVCNFAAFADTGEATAITAYITISKYGKIVNDKNGVPVAEAEVTLTDKASYCLDDVFRKAHTLYYDGNEQDGYGYDSAEAQYGLSITKLWDDTSGYFGYQVNRGTETVANLSHPVKDGDYIDLYINQSSYWDGQDSYTRFNASTVSAYVGDKIELTLEEAGYDDSWNTVYSPCSGASITIDGVTSAYTTDSDGKASVTFDRAGKYIISASKSKAENASVTAITAPILVATVKALPDAVISVPSDVELFVGAKTGVHFTPFTEIEPATVRIANGTAAYYFTLNDNKAYNFRITSDKYITYAGIFTKTSDFSLSITDTMLQSGEKTKSTVDRNTSSNSGYNVADIYLNINPQGYLKLNKGEKHQIVNLRSWEAAKDTVNNYFIEPDYHYSVIDENGNDSNVVSVDKNGLLTANTDGTAIVLVTYDALKLDFGSGADFYGAIWPENTGVFVVSVGADESNIDPNITLNKGKNTDTLKLSGDYLDAEHDVLYFTGDSGSFTFTPKADGASVKIANPTLGTALSYNGFQPVTSKNDGSFTVPLTAGRNIVKIEKDNACEYQVITAKKVNVTVNNGAQVQAGDTLSIVFDKLYHPVNKLAGIYNMTANAVYTNVSAYDGKTFGGEKSSYTFANTLAAQSITSELQLVAPSSPWSTASYKKIADLTVPADYEYDTFTLSGGMLFISGFGDPCGNHRDVSYESGRSANTNAKSVSAYLGALPDIEIPIVATDADLSSISLDLTNVETDCYAGSSFDTSGLKVTANYSDGTSQIALGYTVTPEILTADTDKVTITYRGKTAEIPVNVSVAKVTGLEITSAPAKTSYQSGDTFDPSGMVVTAVYENNVRKATTSYTYSPNRTLTVDDSEITVSYIGEDKSAALSDVGVPITVTASGSSGSTSDTITVYFTLYGDSKHGTPGSTESTHTLASNNLESWIAETAVTVNKGSYVIDAISKALSFAGIPYTNSGNYITAVKGLKAFDNGNLSGWMYTLNGKYPLLGVNEQQLSNGDKIVFHYTDDYTQEKSFESHGSSSSGSTVKDKNAEEEDNSLTEAPADEAAASTEFSDVLNGEWYEEAVLYTVKKGLFRGTSKTEFSPHKNMTRAELLTVLHRLDGEGNPSGENTFSDIPEGEWYTDAVIWAAENKIANGTSKTEFSPNDSITREQVIVILYRYALMKGLISIEDSKSLDEFVDYTDISDYASDAMSVAISIGLLKGDTSGRLLPQDTATRAEIAAILMRFLQLIAE